MQKKCDRPKANPDKHVKWVLSDLGDFVSPCLVASLNIYKVARNKVVVIERTKSCPQNNLTVKGPKWNIPQFLITQPANG